MLKIVIPLLISVCPMAVAQQVSAPSEADFVSSGNAFLRICQPRDEKRAFTRGVCSGYVIGVADGVAMLTADSPYFCSSANVENGQKYDVVVKYIKEHPEKAHLQTPHLIVDAMIDAFPCPKGK